MDWGGVGRREGENDSTREDLACTAFERLFRERGLPAAIRSDNDPFASPNALFNLSKLSVHGRKTSVNLEDAFWDEVKAIARCRLRLVVLETVQARAREHGAS